MSDGSYQPFFSAIQPSCSNVATEIATDATLPDWGKGAEFRQFQRDRSQGVASVAAVAGGAASELPWEEGIQRLLGLPKPECLDKARWDELLFDACRVHEVWGDTLHALGWATSDIFGCNPDPYVGRLDRHGLVIFLRGREVTGVAERTAVIDRGADRQTFRRDFDLSAAVPLWVAFSTEGGP